MRASLPAGRLAGRFAKALAAPLALAAALAGLAPAAPAAAASAACLPGPGVQPVNPGTQVDKLQGVTVLSACNAWAVGFESDDFTLGTDKTLIEHWDGKSWTVLPSPDPGNTLNELTSVRAISPANIWAVGFFDNGTGPRTLTVHWNGIKWKRVPSPNPGGPKRRNELDAVTASSATSARAVGTFTDPVLGQTTLILRWNGTRWTHVVAPASELGELLAVTGTSPASSWAVGDSFDPNGQVIQAMALHCC